MKLIIIHKFICIISVLHLFANVVHSAEPSTSVTLSGATEQPSSIHISKRIASSATETTPENIDSTSDTNNPATSNDMTQQQIVTPDQSSTQDPQTTDPVVTTDPPVESTTDPVPTTVDPTTPEPTTPEPTTTYDASTSSEQPTTSDISSTTPPIESTTSESSAPPSTSSQPPSSTSVPPSSSRHSRSITSSHSQSSSLQPSSTSSDAPTASATSQPDNSDSNKTGTIAGAVVGSVVGAALIIGLLTWFNRKGGCTKRRKDEIDQNDYTIDMNQTDFSPAAGGAAASVAAASKVAANEPISPFDHSRRFVPPTSNANYEGGEYDYNNYPPQQDYTYQDQQYGYYDANGYPQQQQYGYEGGYDSNRHEVQNDNYSYYTGPSASRTSGSDWNQGVVSDKPNLKDQKPNQA